MSHLCSMYLLKQFLSDKEIECRVSRPPTKIGDLLFHGENDNNDSVSCLGAKSFFKLFRYIHTILLGENFIIDR